MRTWVHTLGFMLAAPFIASCGLRTAISPEADVDQQQAGDGGMQQPCGFGPPCNPDDLGGRTCESLGLGAGDLACDPSTCNLNLKGCGSATNVKTGQTGTGGQSGGDMTGLFGGVPGAGTIPGLFGGDAGIVFPPGFFGGTTPTDEDGGTAGGGTGTVPFPGGFFFGGGNGGFFGGGFFGGGNNGGGNSRGSSNNGAGNSSN
jgi:hypothetical protein